MFFLLQSIFLFMFLLSRCNDCGDHTDFCLLKFFFLSNFIYILIVKVRPLWRSYTRATDGIIFVLDAADRWKSSSSSSSLSFLSSSSSQSLSPPSYRTSWCQIESPQAAFVRNKSGTQENQHTKKTSTLKIWHTKKTVMLKTGRGESWSRIETFQPKAYLQLLQRKSFELENKAMNVLGTWDNISWCSIHNSTKR